jgi:hypothetical protein
MINSWDTLQEVDHFDELDQEFGKIGYSGIFKVIM